MRNNYFVKRFPALLCLLLFAALPFVANGQVSWKESFDYVPGNLNGLGGWVNLGYDYSNPVQVEADQLSYEGYAATVPAKSVHLVGTNGSQNVMTAFIGGSDAKGVTEGELFASMLVRVNAVPEKAVPGYFFSFLKATPVLHDFTAGSSPYDWGRVFVCPGSESGKFRFGISYYKSNAEAQTADLELGKTYHIVAKVAINENGDKLDNFYLYVDPASATDIPASATIGSKGSIYSCVSDDKAGYGLKGVELMQKMSYGAGTFDVNVADLRVADSYSALFSGGSASETPVVTASAESLQFGAMYTGTAVTRSLNVKGSNLKGDITISTDNAALTPSVTSIKASDASAANGTDVEFTLKPTVAALTGSATITLSSEGADPVKVTATWTAVPITEMATVKQLVDADAESAGVLRFTGKALVSYVDKSTTPYTYYIQDETAGIKLCDEEGALGTSFFRVGDALTGMVAVLSESLGQNYLVLMGKQGGLIASSHNNIVPVTATLAEIAAAPKDYASRVVFVKGAKLSGFESGATFAEDMTQPTVTDASGTTGKLRIFKGTTLIGTDIPTSTVNIVGLSTSASAVVIGPRQAEDITVSEEEEPGITLSAESFLSVRGKVGNRTEIATVHVKAVGMADKVTIAPSYSVQDVFSTDVTELPAGTSETDVRIYYEPTAVGKNNGYIYFNLGSDLIAEIRINAMATDPATPPSLTIDPAEVEPFKAEPGEEVSTTVKVTPVGMPDFINVRLEQEGSAFLIGTSLLSAKGEQDMKITFRPSTAGTYEGRIVFSSEFFDEDIVLPISGTAATTPVIPEDQEGDALPLSKDNPLTELKEDFSSATSNKPLSLEGWKNLAMTGKRAWWGYTFPDTDEDNAGEFAAKVTAYDSSVAEGEESACQMMLVTPALDYLNSKTQIFAFRVMGKYLVDDAADKLELCYISELDGDLYIEPISEVVMPAGSDEAGEWVDFEVNLDGLNLDDVFFLGFRFTGTRGTTSAATYYIDDVTYGFPGSDGSGISSLAASSEGKVTGAEVYDLTGRKLRTAATVAAAKSGLPAGTYLLRTTTLTGSSVKKIVKK